MLRTVHNTKVHPRGGFTIVEIIVVFILIGILTGILVPVIANRANDARIAAAISDIENLAGAQERVQIDTGYWLRMHALDDLSSRGDGIPNSSFDNVLDSIFDNGNTSQQDNTYANPEILFISPATQDFALPAAQRTILGNETSYAGNGPYINWQKLRDINNNDWPDDPWGNDYMLFTRVGCLIPSNKAAGSINNEVDRTGSDNNATTGEWDDRSYQFFAEGPEAHDLNNDGINKADDIFDRPVILSLGPDGLPGDGTPTTRYGEGDDIYRAFGGGRSNSFRLGGTGL